MLLRGVVMSFIDNFTNKKDRYVMRGTYIPKLPLILGDTTYKLQYEIADSSDRAFEDIIPNLPDEVGRMAIRTVTHINYKTNAYIKAQDGLLYQIRSVKRREPKGANKQVLWLRRTSPNAEYELLLVQYNEVYDEE